MPATLKLRSISFVAGSRRNAPPLEIQCPSVTVLVGPNNSGKSQTLREIESEFTGENAGDPRVVVGTVGIDAPDTAAEIMELLEPFNRGTPAGQQPAPVGHFWLRRPTVAGQSEVQSQIPENGFEQWLSAGRLQHLKVHFMRFLTRRLDGSTRFNLVTNQPSGPLERPPANHLWSLFQDASARAKVSAFTQGAFGRHFVVDPTGMTEFRMRLSDRAPSDIAEEQGLDPRAQAFHGRAPLVISLGDGVKASVGLVAAVHCLPDRILLVDEPEAFLHPTLARRIGRELAETVRQRDASLVAATHSAEFLTGCMQATQDLRLVRLTYEQGEATARTLEPDDVKGLMNDPLLRSANALRALFHRGVVVCEADADRAFYEEANVRLVNDARGIDDALFMNAQNWQTIPRIAEPLRRLGVPAAGLFDLDVLMDENFQHLWPLVQASPAALRGLQNRRARAKAMFEVVTRKRIKEVGLGAFTGLDLRFLKALLSTFAEYGIFFVPVGELESWLPQLGRKKASWVLKAFNHMGGDPQTADYVRAGHDGVWAFLDGVKRWIDDPARRGLPD